MAFFTPMQQAGDHGFIPRELIREEPWGEIWRAVWLKENRHVLLVAYTTHEGDALFEEASPGLHRWQEVAGRACPHLLKIWEISEGAIPYVLVEDPEGPSLREHVNSLTEDMPLEEQGTMGNHVMIGVVEGEAYDVGPVGVTPDTIFRAPEDRDAPWKLLPVAPRTKGQCRLLAEGRYFPPDCASNPSFTSMHVDSYSVAWIWAEVFRRNFDAPRMDLKSAIPFKSLAYVLENSLQAKNGIYNDPQVVVLGIDRWLRKTLKADLAEMKEAELRRKRGPILNLFYDHGFKMAVVAGVLLVIAAIGGGIYLLMESRTLGRPLTKLRPEDVGEMYRTALLAGSVDEAASLSMGGGADQTRELFQQLDAIKQKGVAKKLAKLESRIAGSGGGRTLEMDLKDESGNVFAVASIMLEQRANMEWNVTNVFLKQRKWE